MTIATFLNASKKLLQKWLKTLLYSSRSHNLLNYATLDIKDTEIKKELVEFRFNWLDRVYKYVCLLVLLDVVWSLILQFGTKTNDAIQLLMSADTLMLMIYWTICRTLKSRWTFAVAPIYLLIHTIELNLLVRDNVAPVFKVVDKKINQNELIYYFLEANLINYMDFRYTVFLLVPLFVLGNVFI
jgi:hypothetical protein